MNAVHQRMLSYFQFSHLPDISSPFWYMANDLANRAEEGKADPAETTVALRKLLEAKDAAVRAALPVP